MYKIRNRNLTEQEVLKMMTKRTNDETIGNRLFLKKEKHFREYLKGLNYFSDNFYILNIKRDFLVTDSVKQVNEISNEHLIHNKLYIRFDDNNIADINKNTEEWLKLVFLNIMNPMYGLFTYSSGNVSHIKPFHCSSYVTNHLSYFYFLGRTLAMALIENSKIWIPLERSVYNFLLNFETTLDDLKIIDNDFYESLMKLKNGNINDSQLFFTDTTEYFGIYKIVDLKNNGRNIQVTNENKEEYFKLLIKYRYKDIIIEQLESIKKGFDEILDKRYMGIFSSSELKELICGNFEIDIKDWQKNTKYFDGFTEESYEIIKFWEIVEKFSQNDKMKLFKFWTGSTQVPYGGMKNFIKNEKYLGLYIKRKEVDLLVLPSSHPNVNELGIYSFYNDYIFKRELLFSINNSKCATCFIICNSLQNMR